MTEPLSASQIFHQLCALGYANADTARNATDDGWRVRTDGGPVIHIYYNGKLVIVGHHARTLRKALGLSGERDPRCKIGDLGLALDSEKARRLSGTTTVGELSRRS